MQRSKFIQIFVYGKLSISSNDLELEDQLLDNSDKKESNGNSQSPDNTKLNFKYFLALFYSFIGLQLSYLTWGVIQEKIMTTHYTKTNLSSHKTGKLQ